MTSNEASVRNSFAAVNSRDLGAWLATIDPSARFYPLDFFPDFDAVYDGHKGFASFWDSWSAPWDRVRGEIVRLDDDGDIVAVDTRFIGEAAAAPPVEMPVGFALTLRDGLVILMVAAPTGAEARDKLLAIAQDSSAS